MLTAALLVAFAQATSLPKLEVDVRDPMGEIVRDALPYCRRVDREPTLEERFLGPRYDDPVRKQDGTWSFEVAHGARYAVGFADVRRSPVERTVEIDADATVTKLRLDIGAPTTTRTLTVRATSPEGRFTFADFERLRFSVRAPESGEDLWTCDVEPDGTEPRFPTTASLLDPRPLPRRMLQPESMVPPAPIRFGTSFQVPPGRYLVRLESVSNFMGCGRTFWWRIFHHPVVEAVVLVEADDVELEIPWPSCGRLDVHAVLPQGTGKRGLFGTGHLPLSIRRERDGTLEPVSLSWTPETYVDADRPSVLTDPLPVGTHELVIEAPGFEPARIQVEVRPDEVRRVEVALVPYAPR